MKKWIFSLLWLYSSLQASPLPIYTSFLEIIPNIKVYTIGKDTYSPQSAYVKGNEQNLYTLESFGNIEFVGNYAPTLTLGGNPTRATALDFVQSITPIKNTRLWKKGTKLNENTPPMQIIGYWEDEINSSSAQHFALLLKVTSDCLYVIDQNFGGTNTLMVAPLALRCIPMKNSFSDEPNHSGEYFYTIEQ